MTAIGSPKDGRRARLGFAAADRPWVLTLLAWTVLVWGSRIRNVLADDDLDGTGQAVRIVMAVVFLALAAAVAVRWRQADRDRWLGALVVWTTGVWLVQGVGMLLDDHGVGFKVIHTILAVVSIGLAVLAWRSRRRAAVPGAAGTTI